jgi:hypothetical protein
VEKDDVVDLTDDGTLEPRQRLVVLAEADERAGDMIGLMLGVRLRERVADDLARACRLS